MREEDLHSKSHLMNCCLDIDRDTETQKEINIKLYDFCLGELATVESGTTSTSALSAAVTTAANSECIIVAKKLGSPRECYDTDK